jgi:hypothetical protein
LNEAIALATRFHEGATDKQGEPYITHPLRVMERVTTPDEKLAAVLHDLLEDTPITERDLRAAGCPAPVVTALDALTRRPDEDYFEFILRASCDPIARTVKLADIADNLDPARLAALDSDVAARLRAKYEPARDALELLPPLESAPSIYASGEPAVAGDDEIVASFACDVCWHPAGRVVFSGGGAPGTHIRGPALVATGVEGRVGFAVPGEKLAPVLAAMRAGDADALHALNVEYTPFWCWKCRLAYCYRHWRLEVLMDDGFYDACYGTCPHGHRVVLGD